MSFELGFATLEEETAVDRLPVRGAHPPWLSGTLVRNGPAMFDHNGRSFRHWFDGQAMLDAASARSFLLVIDAASFAELARAEVPHAIPFGFHGQFSTP